MEYEISVTNTTSLRLVLQLVVALNEPPTVQ